MAPRGHRLLVASAVVALAGLVAGVALAAGSPSGFVKVSFPRFRVSLRHPAAWATLKWCWTGAQETPVALLTPAQPPPRCTKPVVGVASSFPPAEQLGAGDVVIAISDLGLFPGAKDTWNARIGGQAADIGPPAYGDKYDTAVTCPAGVRREYRSAGVRWARAQNALLKAEAVICGPDLAAGNATFLRVLHSVRFAR